MESEVWVRTAKGFKTLENCDEMFSESHLKGVSYLAVSCDKCGSRILLPEMGGNVTVWDDADSLFLLDDMGEDDSGEDIHSGTGGTIIEVAYHGKCPGCGAVLDAEIAIRCERGGSEVIKMDTDTIKEQGCRIERVMDIAEYNVASPW